ncbi:putative ribonuclease H protein [Camellia lanceoleosa]|uniref:Ribonuclease H protein n=1 Tax=Camellia lanceoleosa TaxID=1840588 RepID=A0ACC0I6D8_9ERIC|nr:putative ribonuclease H protein [Camellia lanceoleosa]
MGVPRGAKTRVIPTTPASPAESATNTGMGDKIAGFGIGEVEELAHPYGAQTIWANNLDVVPMNETAPPTSRNPNVASGPQYFVTEPSDPTPSSRAHFAESLAPSTEFLGAEDSAVSPVIGGHSHGAIEDFRVHSRRPSSCGVHLVQDVIKPRTKSWVKPKLEAVVFSKEVDAIVAIPISIENFPDSFIWHHEAKGSYTVKSGYVAMVNKGTTSSHSTSSSSFCWTDKEWKFIWGLTLPPKIKHFAWRMCHNFLALRQSLHLRWCVESNLCQICHVEIESIEHLLVGCFWTKAVWFGSGLGLRMAPP